MGVWLPIRASLCYTSWVPHRFCVLNWWTKDKYAIIFSSFSSPNFVEGEQQDSSGSDARQFSPPNLPLGVPAIISRPNRKSSSPRRLNPFDRSSREAFRQSLSSSPQRRRSLFADSTGNKRPPSALNVSAIQERSITSSADTEGDTSKRLQVDIDASSLYTASHEEQIAASASPSTAASGHKEEGDEVIEETQEMQQMTEKADDTEDFVESSQEPDSSEPSFIMIPDTEKELDDREVTKPTLYFVTINPIFYISLAISLFRCFL